MIIFMLLCRGITVHRVALSGLSVDSVSPHEILLTNPYIGKTKKFKVAVHIFHVACTTVALRF